MSDFQEAIKVIKKLERDVSKENVLSLMSTGFDLWNFLRKAEEEAEFGQTDDKDQDITDLPEVPPQQAQGSSMRAYEALDQVASMLEELVKDPELSQQLDGEDMQRLKVVSQWLHQGPKTPMHLMKGDVAISVKAIIESDKGTLVLKDATSDFWDLPGGHVNDGETINHALVREVFEETGMSVHGAEEQFVKVLNLGGEVKPVIFFKVDASGAILLSEEHEGYQWVDQEMGLQLNLGVFKEILYPGADDQQPVGPAHSMRPGSSSGGAAFHAMVKGMFNTVEAAIAAIESEHGGPMEHHVRGDGDVILVCPAHGDMWYVTNDGMAFEYWHPESAASIEMSQSIKGMGPGGATGGEDDLTNSHFEAELVGPTAGDYPAGGHMEDTASIDHPTPIHMEDGEEIIHEAYPTVPRTSGRVEQDYDIGVETDHVEMTAGGQIRQVAKETPMTALENIMIEGSPAAVAGAAARGVAGAASSVLGKEGGGDGGGGIAGAGDSMVASDVHTDTGGKGKKRKKDFDRVTDMRTEKDPHGPRDFDRVTQQQELKIIKRREVTIPIIGRKDSVKLKKAVKTDPSKLNMKIIYKAVGEGGTPFQERYIIAGYASPVMIDLEGHKITHEALVNDLPRFMSGDGEYANLNVMHSNVTVGKIIPEFSVNGMVYRTQVDEIGLYVVAEVRTDPDAPDICKQVIDDIESGILRSFSISGNAENPTFTCDEEQCFYSINDLQLYEITLCEEGVNPEAKFDVVTKSVTLPEWQGGQTIERFEVIEKAIKNPVNESELLRYFHAFANLFNMYHNTGGLSVVLYDAAKGEVVLPDHTDDDAFFPYTEEDVAEEESEKVNAI